MLQNRSQPHVGDFSRIFASHFFAFSPESWAVIVFDRVESRLPPAQEVMARRLRTPVRRL
jgi:hypothetical protein